MEKWKKRCWGCQVTGGKAFANFLRHQFEESDESTCDNADPPFWATQPRSVFCADFWHAHILHTDQQSVATILRTFLRARGQLGSVERKLKFHFGIWGIQLFLVAPRGQGENRTTTHWTLNMQVDSLSCCSAPPFWPPITGWMGHWSTRRINTEASLTHAQIYCLPLCLTLMPIVRQCNQRVYWFGKLNIFPWFPSAAMLNANEEESRPSAYIFCHK